MQVVTRSLTTHHPDSATIIQQAFQDLEVILTTGNNTKDLNKLLNLCSPIEESLDSLLDISNLYQGIASQFSYVVQYNQDDQAAVGSIDSVCNILANTTLGGPLERVAEVNNIILTELGETCLDYKYDTMVDSLRNASWESEEAEGTRQWFYQTCTEFGFYQSSSGKPQTFGDKFSSVEFFIHLCADVYGEKFTQHFLQEVVDKTNVLYGGLDIDVTNVAFVQGSVDPWNALGVTSSSKSLTPAILIEGRKLSAT